MQGAFYGESFYATKGGNISIRGLAELQNEVYRQSLSPGNTGSTGDTEQHVPKLFIFGIIRDESTITSSDSSSGVDLSPTGVGFYDSDGFVVYAFDEINSFEPWKGEVLEGGISTNLPSESLEGGGNWAYTLNGETLEADQKVILMRTGNYWLVVDRLGGTSSSDTAPDYDLDCENLRLIAVR